MNPAVLGVGSNIEPEKNIACAVGILTKTYSGVRTSRWIWTPPLVNRHQPEFLNGAVYLETSDSREDFLKNLKKIEKALGRTPAQRGAAPRVIDLDLVVWKGKIVNNDFFSRPFLRTSVLELLPDLPIPPKSPE